jgi:hypothetical protein
MNPVRRKDLAGEVMHALEKLPDARALWTIFQPTAVGVTGAFDARRREGDGGAAGVERVGKQTK